MVVWVFEWYVDDEEMFKLFFLFMDVMLIGYYVVVLVDFEVGDIVVVIGDGVVGLCGVFVVKCIGVE